MASNHSGTTVAPAVALDDAPDGRLPRQRSHAAPGSLDTGALDTGSLGTGSFDNGAYGTGSFDTGSFDTGAFDTNSFGTGSVGTGSFDTGALDTTLLGLSGAGLSATGLRVPETTVTETTVTETTNVSVTTGSEATMSEAPVTDGPANGLPPVMDPGEILRIRILDQVRQAREAEAAERAAREAAIRAKEAAAQKVRDDLARKKAEEAARRKAEEEAAAEAERLAAEEAARAERERLAQLAVSYVKPVASYTLSGDFGGASSPWVASNSGQDFAVPTGTPAVAIHTGTITAAGWAGAFGYRIVLTLDDGTQLWYCHLSSMVKTAGRVTTGDVIGRVGATGNAAAPMLHLEVRPGGAAPVDPVGWLADHGVAV
jgi:murein DD-endopeptidase MepM/ murein hydrolase activator NlpD